MRKRLRELAKINGKFDMNFYEVLKLHCNYTHSDDVYPTELDGIKFYEVGHNASHCFYIGRDSEGNYYRGSLDCCELAEINYSRVNFGGFGYLGHF